MVRPRIPSAKVPVRAAPCRLTASLAIARGGLLVLARVRGGERGMGREGERERGGDRVIHCGLTPRVLVEGSQNNLGRDGQSGENPPNMTVEAVTIRP